MIRIVLAEDQRMVRGALAALLNLEEDLEVVGEADDGISALKMIRDTLPDICILDIEMPGMSGLEVAELIEKEQLSSRVVILTTFARSGYLQRALKAGVKGYLLKDSPLEELAYALRLVHSGGRMMSPELAISVWDEENPLSERDQEVLRLACEGLTTGQIAQRLFLSEGTIRNYMSEVLHKVGAKNRIEAGRIAQSKGWI